MVRREGHRVPARRSIVAARRMLCAGLALLAGAMAAQAQGAFPAFYLDAALYREAIASEAAPAKSLAVTGLTMPHHLVAADLMVRAFRTVEGARYDRVILLSPDHFFKSRRTLATTTRSFDTIFGPVPVDAAATQHLASFGDIAEESDLFVNEHGIAALLPLVRRFLPDIPIVPVTVAIGSKPADWDRAAQALRSIITDRTLVIQSTDFSHYLPVKTAIQRDQETLNVIASADMAALAALRQPDHLDARGAQAIQTLIQRDVFASHGVVIANRNQAEYEPVTTSTTSYIAMAYARDAGAASALRYSDQHTIYFGGDVFAGRRLAAPLNDPAQRARIIAAIREKTAGGDLIVNLEGVMLDDPPPGLNPDLHVFASRPAGDMLKQAGIVAAGLANNHAADLGPRGRHATIGALKRAGIRPLEHMAITDMGAFRLVALNTIGRGVQAGYPVVTRRDLDRLCRAGLRQPLVALMHWGQEYTTEPPAETLAQAEDLHACGVRLLIGAHSHQAAPRPLALRGGDYAMVYSLGNLLFDQPSAKGTGALLELRIFAQGTMAVRLIPMPNLYDMMARAPR